MDRGAWRATVRGVAMSQTQMSTHALTQLSIIKNLSRIIKNLSIIKNKVQTEAMEQTV